jgi:transposase-like protein
MAQSNRSLWAKRVERWKDSGLTLKEFASEIGVNPNTLSHWNWRLSKESRPAPRKKANRVAPKKKPAKKATADAVQFIEVTPPPAASDVRFEIELRRGRRIFVPASFDAEALRQLVDVLEAH